MAKEEYNLYIRQPTSAEEITLLARGWQFAGFVQYTHPQFPTWFFNLEKTRAKDPEVSEIPDKMTIMRLCLTFEKAEDIKALLQAYMDLHSFQS